MIIESRKIELQGEIARNKLIVNPPKSVIDTIPFDPSLPQELLLNVFPGFPGSISFYDNTGAPWPIAKIKQGSKDSFISEKMPGYSYSLEAKAYGVSNTGWFVLDGLDTVIPFRISSEHSRFFNARRQVIIPLEGPNAVKPVMKHVTSYSNVDITKSGPETFAFISGTTSGIEGAKEVTLRGIPGQAFIYKDFVYIRTTAELKGKGSSLIEEHTLGDNHLYQLYKRAFYWFYSGRKKVKAFVEYPR